MTSLNPGCEQPSSPNPDPAHPSPAAVGDELSRRARGGVGWLLLTVLIGWFFGSGIDLETWRTAVTDAAGQDGTIAAVMSTFWTFGFLFLALVGQTAGEELASEVWRREERLLRAARNQVGSQPGTAPPTAGPGAGTASAPQTAAAAPADPWRANLLTDPFGWMAAVHGWLDRLWFLLPAAWREIFGDRRLQERIDNLLRRLLALGTGLTGTFLLILLLRHVNSFDEIGGHLITATQTIVYLGFITQFYALAFTRIPPATLLVTVPLAWIYHAITTWLDDGTTATLFVQVVVAGFMLLLGLRRLRKPV